MKSVFVLLFLVLCMVLSACEHREEVALGTLEWDRISLPAPVAEKIVSIDAREGQRVSQGQVLLQLDPRETRARLGAAEAAVARQAAALEELTDGPRVEEIARARAELDATKAEARDRQADFRRLQALGEKNYASRSDIDAAQASAESAQAQVRAAMEQLLELERGTRFEEIEQGRAALEEARAQARAQRVLLGKLTVRAPQPGVVDSIPFKLGDEAPLGAALVVMLTGETPYARVYVPQPLRLQVQVGGGAQVFLQGGDITEGQKGGRGPFSGQVRMVRNEPSFTPYYALTGDDVTRLSYIAEIQLEHNAAHLPAGLPLKATFSGMPKSSASPQTNADTAIDIDDSQRADGSTEKAVGEHVDDYGPDDREK